MLFIALRNDSKTIVNLENVDYTVFKKVEGSNPYYMINIHFNGGNLLHSRYGIGEERSFNEDRNRFESYCYNRK